MKIGKKLYTMTALVELLKTNPAIILELTRNSREIDAGNAHLRTRQEVVEFINMSTKGIVAMDVDVVDRRISVHFELETDLAMFLVRFS